MYILDGVDEWNLEVESWLELSLELLKSVKQESILFGHDDSKTKVLSVVFANPLRVILFTLAVITQIVASIGKLTHQLRLCYHFPHRNIIHHHFF